MPQLERVAQMIEQNLDSYDRSRGLEALLDSGETDPRILHDAVLSVVSGIEASRHAVPTHLRRALEELEADIAEAYFNNVPV